ncbi:uncharacterized protein A4U43_C04F12580 [Asparagus officinalis]|uniref:Alpha-1,3-glucosyltransferase n=1 Tax=Asparagus officinalis TaxID=4686 RepID=A0A5P1F0D1_ASPOF|nr:uncharacterized protein A4U43_C04F12580 [Asparagus officinalis]
MNDLAWFFSVAIAGRASSSFSPPSYRSTDFEVPATAGPVPPPPPPRWYSDEVKPLDPRLPPTLRYFEASSSPSQLPGGPHHRGLVIQQVLRRLFPFGRGLCHAYWAPNFWVFYIVLDKVLAFVFAKLGFTIQMPKASFTGGLVGDSSPFAVLPQVTPIITFLLVVLAMAPCLVKAFLKPQPRSIIRWVAYAYTCGFMFGWHVHEKASLHFTIPLGIIALNSLEDARHYFLLSIVSCYSMFPLLFEPQEYPIKLLLLVIHSTLMWAGFSLYFSKKTAHESTTKTISKDSDQENILIGWVGFCYLFGLVFIEIWGQILHPYLFGSKLQFLPLMLISVYCAIGMMYSWAWQLIQIIQCT